MFFQRLSRANLLRVQEDRCLCLAVLLAYCKIIFCLHKGAEGGAVLNVFSGGLLPSSTRIASFSKILGICTGMDAERISPQFFNHSLTISDSSEPKRNLGPWPAGRAAHTPIETFGTRCMYAMYLSENVHAYMYV